MKTASCVSLMMRSSTLTIALMMAVLVFASGEKIKPEELVAKHLASIGNPEARNAVRNRTILGDVDVVFRMGSSGQLSGKGHITTEGPMIRMGMMFDHPDYPGELIAYDGKKVTVAQLAPAARVFSPFAEFVLTFDALLKEGLPGGALSTAWPLLNLTHRQPSLKYMGLARIEGKQLHELTYEMRRGNRDLLIALYFDPETYRHVRSQYRLGRPRLQQVRSPERSWQGGGGPDVRSLVETFDDFKEVDGLMLPHQYKITYQQEGYLAEWSFTVKQILHNQRLDANLFVVQ